MALHPELVSFLQFAREIGLRAMSRNEAKEARGYVNREAAGDNAKQLHLMFNEKEARCDACCEAVPSVADEALAVIKSLHGVVVGAPGAFDSLSASLDALQAAGYRAGASGGNGGGGPGTAAPKILAALTKHHQYKDRGCMNHDPIGSNELAKAAKVGAGSVSAFWKSRFESQHGAKDGTYDHYKQACFKNSIAIYLALWNGEAADHKLLTNQRGDEDEGDE